MSNKNKITGFLIANMPSNLSLANRRQKHKEDLPDGSQLRRSNGGHYAYTIMVFCLLLVVAGGGIVTFAADWILHFSAVENVGVVLEAVSVSYNVGPVN